MVHSLLKLSVTDYTASNDRIAKDVGGGGLALTGSTVPAFTCRHCRKVRSRDRLTIDGVSIGNRIY
jgi:hypothetical protein